MMSKFANQYFINVKVICFVGFFYLPEKTCLKSNVIEFADVPYSGFCLRGPNLCELCEMPRAHTF